MAKTSQAEKAMRLEKVASLFAKGVRSYPELAKLTGVTTKTISRDIETLREAWAKQATDTFSRATGQLLSELNLRKREIWAYWMRTLKPATEGGEQPTGDPRAFTALKDVMEQEMKLLGLPAPDAVTAEVTNNLVTVNMIPTPLLEQLNRAIDRSLDSPALPGGVSHVSERAEQTIPNELIVEPIIQTGEETQADDTSESDRDDDGRARMDRQAAEAISSASNSASTEAGIEIDLPSPAFESREAEEGPGGDGACGDGSGRDADGADDGQDCGEEDYAMEQIDGEAWRENGDGGNSGD